MRPQALRPLCLPRIPLVLPRRVQPGRVHATALVVVIRDLLDATRDLVQAGQDKARRFERRRRCSVRDVKRLEDPLAVQLGQPLQQTGLEVAATVRMLLRRGMMSKTLCSANK